MPNNPFKIACFIFEDMELLDFAGPYEVFSLITQLNPEQKVEIYVFGEEAKIYRTINGLALQANYRPDTLPEGIDLLLLPGGDGSRLVYHNSALNEQLKKVIAQSTTNFSVCSGARFLAIQGLLENRQVVTHQSVYEDIQKLSPKAILRYKQRFADEGDIITSGGISAGIDAALYIVEKYFGKALANKIKVYMEYGNDWHTLAKREQA